MGFSRSFATRSDYRGEVEMENWRLPPAYDSKSYDNLITNTYGAKNSTKGNYDTRIIITPISLLRAGSYNYSVGTRNGRGSYGGYWESRVYNGTTSYTLYFYSTDVNPRNYYLRGRGFTVRCVSKNILVSFRFCLC